MNLLLPAAVNVVDKFDDRVRVYRSILSAFPKAASKGSPPPPKMCGMWIQEWKRTRPAD